MCSSDLLRKQYPEFRHSNPEDFKFMDVGEKTAVAYTLKNKFFVALNGSNANIDLDLPQGEWAVLVDRNGIYTEDLKMMREKVSLPKTSGIVFLRN